MDKVKQFSKVNKTPKIKSKQEKEVLIGIWDNDRKGEHSENWCW